MLKLILFRFSSLYRNSTVVEDYCEKIHYCHSTEHTMCPDRHGPILIRECYPKDYRPEKVQYRCLKRGDLSNTTIFHNPASGKKTRFPQLLNDHLEFNETGFWCDKENDTFLQWTREDIYKLRSNEIPHCSMGEYGLIDATILYRLLKNDLSFKPFKGFAVTDLGL